MENAIDAGATAITVEITDGGKKLIRITDNGSGMDAEQVPLAFLRHATSKIEKVEDLTHIASLGFRGEALSSIAAVSQVELITKTPSGISGTRYVIEGGKEQSLEEMGAPEGTTFLIRNLFYNTPARSKFLKSDMTEAGYINTLMEQLALSHPEISFKYIQNRQVKLSSSGNYSVKDVIYSVYGREIAKALLDVSYENDFMKIEGFVGKPEISRGNRTFENYYINGRYVKNKIQLPRPLRTDIKDLSCSINFRLSHFGSKWTAMTWMLMCIPQREKCVLPEKPKFIRPFMKLSARY